MSIQEIIRHAIDKNPLALKEALEEELRGRVALALEAKMSEQEEEDEGMTESFDLSDLTLEELEDFMMSKEFEQIDEISKKTLASYVKKAADDMRYREGEKTFRDAAPAAANLMGTKSSKELRSKIIKRSRGIDKAVDRLAESFDLSDLTLEELEDFMMSKEFEQIDEISKKTLASYVKKAADDMRYREGEKTFRDAAPAAANLMGTKSSKELRSKIIKRSRGIDKAVDRLAESFDLSDLTLEELEDFMMSEEFDQLDEETQDSVAYYYEALTPEQRKAREANRKGGRRGKHDPEARKFFHDDLRGKKGAERTAMGRDPVSGSVLTKHGRAGMSKIGKHGAAGGGSSFKPNRQTALTKARILNQRMHNKSGMVSADKYGKSKLPM
jgi:hypothetical protein